MNAFGNLLYGDALLQSEIAYLGGEMKIFWTLESGRIPFSRFPYFELATISLIFDATAGWRRIESSTGFLIFRLRGQLQRYRVWMSYHLGMWTSSTTHSARRDHHPTQYTSSCSCRRSLLSLEYREFFQESWASVSKVTVEGQRTGIIFFEEILRELHWPWHSPDNENKEVPKEFSLEATSKRSEIPRQECYGALTLFHVYFSSRQCTWREFIHDYAHGLRD